MPGLTEELGRGSVRLNQTQARGVIARVFTRLALAHA
jgi:hypothetical protein